MANIFEALQERSIPYAVVVCVEKMRVKSIESSNRAYYIIMLKRDKKKMLDFRLKQSSEYIRTIVEYDLKEAEIEYFKKHADYDYTKDVHTNEGRVYNRKGFNFKHQYDAFKDELGIV
jgi:hypothetical protein